MSYTNVDKPTSTTYTGVYFPGKEIYDETDLDYDSSTTYFDSANLTAYTRTLVPAVNWNLTVASLLSTTDVSAKTGRAEWVFFSPDGSRMYLGDGTVNNQQKVHQYALSTVWDMSTLGFVQTLSLSTTIQYSDAGFFNNDGTKMYIASYDPPSIWEYDLTTPWDISTATVLRTFTTPAESSAGIYFSPDGLKMFLVSYAGVIREFELFEAWNVVTAVQRDTLDITATTDDPDGLFFKPDGRRFYFTHAGSPSKVFEYTCCEPWLLGTASLSDTLQISAGDIDLFGTFFKDDGSRMFLVYAVGDDIREYGFTESWTNISKPT